MTQPARDRVAVIIDYGGVLAQQRVQPFFGMLATKLGAREEEVASVIAETTSHGHEYRANRIDGRAFWAVVCEHLDSPRLHWEDLQRLWAYSYKVSTATLSVLADIRRIPDVVLGQYSNEDRLRWLSGQRRYATEDLFDFSVLSWQVGALKGDPGFEAALQDQLESHGCTRAIIVDDKESHVAEAETLGHIGVHFLNHARLRFELERELRSASRDSRVRFPAGGDAVLQRNTQVVLLMEEHFARPLETTISRELGLHTRVDSRSVDEIVSSDLGDAHALVYSGRPISHALLEQAGRLRVVVKWGTGLDDIDLAAADRLGIDVIGLPSVNTVSVSEHAILLALAQLRRLDASVSALRRLQWTQSDIIAQGLDDLEGSTVGLVGFGSIGRSIWQRLKPFGVRCLYYKPSRLDPADEERIGVSYATLADLIRQSDVVILALPLTPASRNLISADLLRTTKDRCVLINVSRASIVEPSALADWLRNNADHRYATDVHAREPISAEDDLPARPNVLATPHVAGRSRRALHALNEACIKVLAEFIAGRTAHDRLRRKGHPQLEALDQPNGAVPSRPLTPESVSPPVPQERVLADRIVYAGQMFNVVARTIEVSPANIVTWEIVDKRTDSVGVVPMDEDGNVYLLEEYFGATNERGLALPKGLLARGENAEQAAARELREETGLAGKLEHLLTVSVSPGYLTQRTTLFLARGVHHVADPVSEPQFQAVRRMPVDKALALIEEGAITEARAVAALLMATRRVGLGT